MSSRLALIALAAAALCGAAPSFAQGSGIDPDRLGYRPEAQPPQAPAQPAAPRAERRQQGPREGQQGPREGNRTPREPQTQGQAQAQRGAEGHRGPRDRGHADQRPDERRHGDYRGNDRRNYGYVVPRSNYYYAPPPVYYGRPPVYYGGVPQTYYPPIGYSGYNAAPIAFQPGDYLPPEYRQQQFVVQDWEWRGLSAPPYGYYWVLLGPDTYALVLASTGQVVSLVAAR